MSDFACRIPCDHYIDSHRNLTKTYERLLQVSTSNPKGASVHKFI